jgi:hypothetical protein
MTDRERFEAWATGNELSLRTGDTMSGPAYFSGPTASAWEAWQASRKQALEEAERAALTVLDGIDAEDGDPADGVRGCLDAIRALANPEGEQG